MLSFKYIPYKEHSNLDIDKKLSKIFGVVKKNKIVLMQGKLGPQGEAKLIEKTMGRVTIDFPGISFCTIYPNDKKKNNNKKKESFIKTTKKVINDAAYNLFMSKRDCLTVIGPATIIKEIRRNPSHIDLLLN
jgi:hypothetical protein